MTSYRGADLSGQDLDGMDFTDCDMMHADLRHAKLAGATFTGAKLLGANLAYADFVGADLSEAQLPEIKMRIAGWNVRVFRDGHIQVGRCQRRTAEEWAEMGAQDIADMTPEEDAPEDFLAERDMVFAASSALRGLY